MYRIISIILLATLVFACGRKQESGPETSEESRAFAMESENFFNSLKTPDEVTSRLMPGMTQFDSTQLNDPALFYQYSGNQVMTAANLGIYISDLNYCILFKKRNQAKKYFESTYELSKALGVEKGTLQFLIIRYEKNLDQNDSLWSVVNQLLNQSTLGLQGTDRERLAGIAMVGYQIENLYLALTTLESLPVNLSADQQKTHDQLMQYIFDQRGKFEIVYHFVRANSDPLDPDRNPNYPFFDNSLRELIDVYRGISQQNPQLANLKEKVEVIRNKIIIP